MGGGGGGVVGRWEVGSSLSRSCHFGNTYEMRQGMPGKQEQNKKRQGPMYAYAEPLQVVSGSNRICSPPPMATKTRGVQKPLVSGPLSVSAGQLRQDWLALCGVAHQSSIKSPRWKWLVVNPAMSPQKASWAFNNFAGSRDAKQKTTTPA